MRFDDRLTTILAADTASTFGAHSAWRQLVDLLARGRVAEEGPVLARLRTLRPDVALGVRAASARAMALATPPVGLVALFVEDDLAVAAPLLRTATLPAHDWLDLLPRLTPPMRAILRHRRDLPADVRRGLDSFGATDFVLGDETEVPPGIPAQPDAAPVQPAAPIPVPPPVQTSVPPPVVPIAPLDRTPFVAIGDAARAIPVVAEALRAGAMRAGTEPTPRFEIADLVARIDEYQRTRVAPSPPEEPAPAVPVDRFRFATDSAGVIRWVEGVARTPLIGVSLASSASQGAARLDAAASGALRTRSAFRDVRLEIAGASPIVGSWRLAGNPDFDRATGRFIGMSGVARRPRADQAVQPPITASDQLRQLVHELRTPTTAIAGFAELIGSELLGPVDPVHRDRALVIQRQAGELLAAIDDLDTAARIEGKALDLRPGTVDLADLVRRAATDLVPLAAERGALLIVDAESAPAMVDDRAAQRLVTRLLTTLLAAADAGEGLRVQVIRKTRSARMAVTRPRALATVAGDALLAIDTDTERDGAPLLGTGFALRLARNLATELGGRLTIEDDRLILRLPVALPDKVAEAAEA